MESPSVSVIIGFKNWGLERLAKCLESLRSSTYSGRLEIVVSDYGSDDHASVRRLADAWRAVYVWSEPVNGWSRAGAINAGFATSTGDILIATDADMIFLPTTVETVADALASNPNDTVILQCRDLPRGYSDSDIDIATIDWSEINRVAQLRPRWGMGGFVANARGTAMRVRGLDERLHTYGGEDIDYATRCRRSGSRVHWLDDERARIYHMWHPPTMDRQKVDAGFSKAVAANRVIYQSDTTVVRNLLGSEFIHPAATPACTIILGDSAEGERRELQLESLLAQSVHAIEVLVPVGSGIETPVISDDSRVRAIARPERSHRRSIELLSLVEQATGAYVIIEDGIAAYAPDWLAELLAGMEGGVSAVTSSSARASDSGELGSVPRGLGDLIFERRALLAALRTVPSMGCTWVDILEHMTLNGLETRDLPLVGRVMLSASSSGTDPMPLAEAYRLFSVETLADGEAGDITRVRAALDMFDSRFDVVVSAGAPELLDRVPVPGDTEVVESEVVDVGSGLRYGLRVVQDLSYVAARRTSREFARESDVRVVVSRSIDAASFEVEVAAAHLLAALYGAPLSANRWIMACVDGDGEQTTHAARTAAVAIRAMNAITRVIQRREQSESVTLFGPIAQGREVDDLLAVTEVFPEGARVRMLGSLGHLSPVGGSK